MIGKKEFGAETARVLRETFNALQGKTLTFTNVAGEEKNVEIVSEPAFMFAVGYMIAEEDLDNIKQACECLKKKAGLAPA